jgi:hypothetical protein
MKSFPESRLGSSHSHSGGASRRYPGRRLFRSLELIGPQRPKPGQRTLHETAPARTNSGSARTNGESYGNPWNFFLSTPALPGGEGGR